MNAIIDARFAGGSIEVDTGIILDHEHVVVLEMPGMNSVPLFPHEARALADALRTAADHAERSAS